MADDVPRQLPFPGLRAAIKAAARKEREERFTREEQLSMVFIAHFLILAGVWVVMWQVFDHGLSQRPPWAFVIWEAVILLMCFVIESGRLQPFISGADKAGANVTGIERWVDEHGARFHAKAKGIALLVAYVLQFVALVPLLEATGGPIDSPFAQVPLAIAIFTPFIANKPWTMAFAVLTTVAYYVVFVSSYGFQDAHAIRPRPGSFVAVNVLILILAFVLTLMYQNRREGRSIGPEGSHITFIRTVRAPRERVWSGWTDPDVLIDWFQIDGTSLSDVQMDVRKGGSWRATMETNGRTTKWSGTYTDVTEPERLAFTLTDENGQERREASLELVDLEGETQMVFRESDSRNRSYERGWFSVLARMVRELEQ